MPKIGFDDERVRDAWFREEMGRAIACVEQAAEAALVNLAQELAGMITRIAQDIEDALGEGD